MDKCARRTVVALLALGAVAAHVAEATARVAGLAALLLAAESTAEAATGTAAVATLLLLAVSAAVLVERGLERGCARGEGGAGVESRRAGSGLLVNVHVLCLLGQVFILPAFGSAVRHACAVRKVLFWEIVEGSSLSSPRIEVGGKCGGLIIK